jgi:hypothetical protein
MPISTQVWVPYPTADNPLNWPDLPEWDSILIGNVVLPIEGIPKYERHLSADPKKPKGSDYYSITSHGIKPSPVHITLKLWVEVNPPRNGTTPPNYLDAYRKLIPQLIAPRFSSRFAIPVYHPTLAVFGVTSIVFTKVPTPQPVGGLVFHVELEGIDGRDVKNGTSQKEKKKSSPNTLAGQPLGPPHPRQFENNLGIIKQTIPTVDGQSYTESWQGRLNTPASRSGAP